MNLILQTAEVVVENVEPAQTMSLGQLFMAGGWLMWLLLALGGAVIFIFFERWWAIRKASRVDPNFMNRIRDMIYDGKIDHAVRLCRGTAERIVRRKRRRNRAKVL